jgi:hypothetical protein
MHSVSRYVSNCGVLVCSWYLVGGSTISLSVQGAFDAQEHGEMMYSFSRPKGQRQREIWCAVCSLEAEEEEGKSVPVSLYYYSESGSLSLSLSARQASSRGVFWNALHSPAAPEVCYVCALFSSCELCERVETKHSALYWFILLFSASVGAPGDASLAERESRMKLTDSKGSLLPSQVHQRAHEAASVWAGRWAQLKRPQQPRLRACSATQAKHWFKRDTNHFQFLNWANLKLWERPLCHCCCVFCPLHDQNNCTQAYKKYMILKKCKI